MASDPYDYLNVNEYYWICVILYTIPTIALVILVLIHALNIFKDLCTTTRSSVQHRNAVPPITNIYITTAILTQFSITCYTITTLTSFFALWSFTVSPTSCAFIVKFAGVFYTISKGSMYILFFCRLHHVYGSSAYKCSPKLLIIGCITNIVYCITFMILLIIFATPFPIKVHRHGMICNATYPDWIVFSVGLYDFSISIIFLIAFTYPLRKVKKLNVKISEKLVKMGIKSKILTWTAIISTLVMLLILAIITPVFIQIDILINCICICLMSPYYPDKIYYYRLCYSCIKCCGGDTQTLEEMELADMQSSSSEI